MSVTRVSYYIPSSWVKLMQPENKFDLAMYTLGVSPLESVQQG